MRGRRGRNAVAASENRPTNFTRKRPIEFSYAEYPAGFAATLHLTKQFLWLDRDDKTGDYATGLRGSGQPSSKNQPALRQPDM